MKEQENKIVAGFFFNALQPLMPGKNDGCIYFDFEKDFAEDDIRCIPMIVRFKLDACGIKLKLSEWSKMETRERIKLTEFNFTNREDVEQYRSFLQKLVLKHTGKAATALIIENAPAWANTDEVPLLLQQKLDEFSWHISLTQWKSLANLQRFVLIKLCQPGHENKNFPKAVKEFGLI